MYTYIMCMYTQTYIHIYIYIRCSMLKCTKACCSMLQCVAACCTELQCATVCCSVLQCVAVCHSVLHHIPAGCSVSHCVAVWCSMLQRVAARHPVSRRTQNSHQYSDVQIWPITRSLYEKDPLKLRIFPERVHTSYWALKNLAPIELCLRWKI